MYHRYVAVGDSQTEGVGDDDGAGGLRGWADRLAARLATLTPDFRYANLAVRGKLAGEVHAEQLEPALTLRPDLATVVAGLNDVLRPRCDVHAVAGHLEAMFLSLRKTGATVATVTFPNVAKIAPLAKPLLPRVLALNALIRAAAARHDVRVVETFPVDVTTDARIWSPDRLHASPAGHQRIADSMAHALGLPGADDTWTHPLPPLPPRTRAAVLRTELQWLGGFVGPWLSRRARGISSGDGRTAKRPDLSPLDAGPLAQDGGEVTY